jgi:hypothetical protein
MSPYRPFPTSGARTGAWGVMLLGRAVRLVLAVLVAIGTVVMAFWWS